MLPTCALVVDVRKNQTTPYVNEVISQTYVGFIYRTVRCVHFGISSRTCTTPAIVAHYLRLHGCDGVGTSAFLLLRQLTGQHEDVHECTQLTLGTYHAVVYGRKAASACAHT